MTLMWMDLLFKILVLHDLNVDESTFKRLVLHGRKEVDQVFMECHLTAGGHRGRDAWQNKG